MDINRGRCCLLIFLLIGVALVVYLKDAVMMKSKEAFFGPVDDQGDVNMNNSCVIRKTDFLGKLSDMSGQMKDTFKDNTKIDKDFEKLYMRFGVLLTHLLMSDYRFNNVFGLTELQTNVKMFRVTVYTMFNNMEKIRNPDRFNRLSQITLPKDVSLWEFHDTDYDNVRTRALKKMKFGLIKGGFLYNGRRFPGLERILVDFKKMLYAYSINTNDVFGRVFMEDSGLGRKFSKHYLRDRTRLGDLDRDFKDLYRMFRYNHNTNTNQNVHDDYVLTNDDFEYFNTKIIEMFPTLLPNPVWKLDTENNKINMFSNYPSDVRCEPTLNNVINPKVQCDTLRYDIRRVQGYFWLRSEIEKWKEFKDSRSLGENKRTIARKMLDYLDIGSNNRKEIFKDMVKKYFYGEEGNIFNKWDDGGTGSYGENYGKYANMKRMTYILQNFEPVVNRLFDPFIIPNGGNMETIRTIISPTCELPPEEPLF